MAETLDLDGAAKPGSLTVVGTGIALGQMTPQARGVIQEADIVLSVVSEPATFRDIARISRCLEDLRGNYAEGRRRIETYQRMVDRVMHHVRNGSAVCFALYGHPGVLAYPAHAAVRAARKEGFPAEMLPGVAADACLFADLGIDPGDQGVQTYVADRLLRGKIWDPTTPLVLWQIGAVGDAEYHRDYPNRQLSELVQRLESTYGPDHKVVVYEAATLPLQPPRTEAVPLSALSKTRLSSTSTLFVPPLAAPRS